MNLVLCLSPEIVVHLEAERNMYTQREWNWQPSK